MVWPKARRRPLKKGNQAVTQGEEHRVPDRTGKEVGVGKEGLCWTSGGGVPALLHLESGPGRQAGPSLLGRLVPGTVAGTWASDMWVGCPRVAGDPRRGRLQGEAAAGRQGQREGPIRALGLTIQTVPKPSQATSFFNKRPTRPVCLIHRRRSKFI